MLLIDSHARLLKYSGFDLEGSTIGIRKGNFHQLEQTPFSSHSMRSFNVLTNVWVDTSLSYPPIDSSQVHLR